MGTNSKKALLGTLLLLLVVTVLLKFFVFDNSVLIGSKDLNKLSANTLRNTEVFISEPIPDEVETPLQNTENDLSAKAQNSDYDADKRIYSEYLADANAGDSRAMYHISVFLDECASTTVVNEESMEKIRQSSLEAHVKKYHLRNMQRCDRLSALLEGKSFRELRDAWLAEAADLGDVFAKLQLERSYPGNSSKDKIKPLLLQALVDSNQDITLKAAALKHFLHYYSDHLESTVDLVDLNIPRRSATRDALDLLHCQYSSSCDVEEMTTLFLTAGYTVFEVEAGLDKAMEFERAIQEENWAVLELD